MEAASTGNVKIYKKVLVTSTIYYNAAPYFDTGVLMDHDITILDGLVPLPLIYNYVSP